MEQHKEEFISLLKSTSLKNVDYLIDELTNWGFFNAPASVNYHLNYQGGLCEHSVSVCKSALAIRDMIIKQNPDFEEKLLRDSVIIVSLLHDVCKSDLYIPATKYKKGDDNKWIAYASYEYASSNLPVGHGEKSVIKLLREGVNLSYEEICAIRWHMGAWKLADDLESSKNYQSAIAQYPLCTVLQLADIMSANILEPNNLKCE